MQSPNGASIRVVCRFRPLNEKELAMTNKEGKINFISKNKLHISPIYLQNREETQGEICSHPEEYFEIIEQGRFKR